MRDYREAPIGAEGFLFEGEVADNPEVQIGNIVYVPPNDADNQIFVLGEVRNPGAYSAQPGRQVRLVDMIARAGGATDSADLAGVKVYERGNIQDYREAPIGVGSSLFEGSLSDNPEVIIGNIIYVPRGNVTVTVIGLVANPGAFEVEPGARLLHVIGRAGGLLANADPTNLVLRRESPSGEVSSRRIDLNKVLTGQDEGGNLRLERGDVLFVQPTIQVAVAGEVRNNGVFNLRSGSRVTDAILAAGGVTADADLNQLSISRQDDGQQIVILVDYEKILAASAENVTLQDGDIVNVSRTDRVVFVVGEVANPGAVRVTDRSRLLDVVYAAGGPTARGDTTAVSIYEPTEDSEIIESVGTGENVESDESVEKADAGGVGEADASTPVTGQLTLPSSQPLPPGTSVFTGRLEENPPVKAGQTVYVPKRTMEIFVLGSVDSPGLLELPRGSRILDVAASLGGPNENGDWRNVQILRNDAPDAEAEVVDVEGILRSPGSGTNVVVRSGDAVYIPPNVAKVSVVGEVSRPGTYTLSGGSKLIDAVAAAGGAADRAALEGVRLLQESKGYEPVEVSLGSNNEFSLKGIEETFRVQDGDVVVVPRSRRITWTQVIAFLGGIQLIKDLIDDFSE